MKMKLFCFILSLNFSIAFADCGYEISAPVFNYSVADTNPTTPGQVTLSRKKDNGIPCFNFFFAFTKGWAGNYNRRAVNLSNNEMLYYNIYKNSNSTGVLKEPSDITSSNEVIAGTINKNQVLNFSYYFTLGPISASTPPKSGTYVDVVQVQAYSGFTNNINSYEGYRDLNIFIQVSKFTSLSLVDTGDVYDVSKTSKTLDFGELEESELLDFDVRVVSNAGYLLKISSSNNGLLKRIDGSGSQSQISYDFYAKNTKKSLSSSASSPVIIASGTGKTPSGGAQIPIKVIIKSVENKDPGTYQDYLTLSVISNE